MKCGDAVYGMGLVGALVFNIQHAVGLGGALIGILKAFLWPAFMVYEVLARL